MIRPIIKPGSQLVLDDEDKAWKLQNSIDDLLRFLGDVVLALEQYDHARNERLTRANDRAARLVARERREIREGELRAELAQQFGTDQYDDEVRFQTELRLREEEWTRSLPSNLAHRLTFYHSRAFIFAVDILLKWMSIVSAQCKDAGCDVTQILASVLEKIPNLVKVRDSAYHIEDRSRGLDRYGRPVSWVGPDKAPGQGRPLGWVYVENLINDRYETMLEDGTVGSVEVTEATLRVLEVAVQEMINALEWGGPKEIWPSRAN